MGGGASPGAGAPPPSPPGPRSYDAGGAWAAVARAAKGAAGAAEGPRSPSGVHRTRHRTRRRQKARFMAQGADDAVGDDDGGGDGGDSGKSDSSGAGAFAGAGAGDGPAAMTAGRSGSGGGPKGILQIGHGRRRGDGGGGGGGGGSGGGGGRGTAHASPAATPPLAPSTRAPVGGRPPVDFHGIAWLGLAPHERDPVVMSQFTVTDGIALLLFRACGTSAALGNHDIDLLDGNSGGSASPGASSARGLVTPPTSPALSYQGDLGGHQDQERRVGGRLLAHESVARWGSTVARRVCALAHNNLAQRLPAYQPSDSVEVRTSPCLALQLGVERLVARVNELVRSMSFADSWSGGSIEKYGSFDTQLWLPGCSDVDLMLMNAVDPFSSKPLASEQASSDEEPKCASRSENVVRPGDSGAEAGAANGCETAADTVAGLVSEIAGPAVGRKSEKVESNDAFLQLADALSDAPFAEHVVVISTASVPVIKFVGLVDAEDEGPDESGQQPVLRVPFDVIMESPVSLAVRAAPRAAPAVLNADDENAADALALLHPVLTHAYLLLTVPRVPRRFATSSSGKRRS